MKYETLTVKTSKLTTAYHRAGKSGLPKLLLLHGNASSSLFFLPVMHRLKDRFEILAPDMRCFGESESLPVDAVRGMRDFSDDLDAFVEAVGWNDFSLLGWSLGGGVCMQYAIDHSKKLKNLILVAPLSPFGFGGTYDEDGKKLKPAGLASGGGCVNAGFVEALASGNRDFAAKTIDDVYVIPTYKIEPELRELFIDSVMSTKVGRGMYPGNKSTAGVWPFITAGDEGICNTMSPKYCDLSAFQDIENKMPVLWIRGAQDIMVSDTSLCDLAYLGKIGAVPGYPGEDVCPVQPMLKQTRYVLEKYKAKGGSYTEYVIPGGHGCMLDNEDGFVSALLDFLKA